MVTLQHLVLPTYLSDLGQDWHTQGWMRDGIVDDLATYAGFVAGEYGSEVDLWVTLNEPTAFAVIALSRWASSARSELPDRRAAYTLRST